IPENAEKNTAKKLLTEYAIQNNFTLTTANSGPTFIHLKCKKGGEYRNWQNLSEEERKCIKNSTRISCPYYIRIGNSKTQGFHYVQSVSVDEHYHKHSLNCNILLATTSGRKAT
ncbi:hypothetical protein K501DRAFT_190654, partial [Backusella circina FSU 941]